MTRLQRGAAPDLLAAQAYEMRICVACGKYKTWRFKEKSIKGRQHFLVYVGECGTRWAGRTCPDCRRKRDKLYQRRRAKGLPKKPNKIAKPEPVWTLSEILKAFREHVDSHCSVIGAQAFEEFLIQDLKKMRGKTNGIHDLA
jgi:hypothetical protein